MVGRPGGVTANHIARYRFSTGAWSALGPGRNCMFYAVATRPDGEVVGGGQVVETVPSVHISTLVAHYRAAACFGDFDCSGILDLGDVLGFVNAWMGNDPRADFSGAGGVTVQDLFDFINAWFAGCG